MWLIFALLSRFLWAGGNAVDQVLSRAHPRYKILSPLVLEFCLYAPYAVVAYFMSGHVAWSPVLFAWIFACLVFYVLALFPYYHCLQEEEAYNIVPYLELTPVFLTLLALTFYGERLTVMQMSGAGLVIACGFIFSWDFRHGRIKKKVLAMMSFSAFLFALYQFCLRSAVDHADVWMVTCYLATGQFLIGITAFLALGNLRKTIVSTCRATAGKTVFLSASVSVMTFLAQTAIIYAFAKAPSTGHVAALSATQPFFSFFLAAGLGKVLPHHFQPMKMGYEIKWKLFLLAGIFCGIYLLTKGAL